MEVNVEAVYFGDSSVYHCTSAIFSKQSIKMTIRTYEDDYQTENILVLKKDIIDLKASEPCAFPVICLKLKDQVCKKIAELLGVTFNSCSKNMTEVWMIIYYQFTSFEVPKFLATDYIEKKNILPCQEMSNFISFSTIKEMLNNVAFNILSERKKRGDAHIEICIQANALIVPQEVRFFAKKFVNYVSNVMKGRALKGREVEVKINSAVFSAYDLKQMSESYKSCLVCSTCQEEAMLKCKGCQVTRYCSLRCQNKDFSKHNEECSLLLVERKKKEVQECLEMEHLLQALGPALVTWMGKNAVQQQDYFNLGDWDERIPYKVWRKKFIFIVNYSVRESIRQKD